MLDVGVVLVGSRRCECGEIDQKCIRRLRTLYGLWQCGTVSRSITQYRAKSEVLLHGRFELHTENEEQSPKTESGNSVQSRVKEKNQKSKGKKGGVNSKMGEQGVYNRRSYLARRERLRRQMNRRCGIKVRLEHEHEREHQC